MNTAEERVILATDELEVGKCLELVRKIGKRLYAVKIHSYFDSSGPVAIEALKTAGAKRVWVDAKLHDIPNTVALRSAAIKRAGADILSVHASGEIDMMKAAVENGPPEIYAITVLTSLSEELAHLTFGEPTKAGALYFARLAALAGVQGVVCSPKEVGILSKRPELTCLSHCVKFITPGVRSAIKDAQDQKRVDKPAAAIKAGAAHIVVGRQITKASDPIAALEEIEREIRGAIAGNP